LVELVDSPVGMGLEAGREMMAFVEVLWEVSMAYY
jgi:hypothetical protein